MRAALLLVAGLIAGASPAGEYNTNRPPWGVVVQIPPDPTRRSPHTLRPYYLHAIQPGRILFRSALPPIHTNAFTWSQLPEPARRYIAGNIGPALIADIPAARATLSNPDVQRAMTHDAMRAARGTP